MSYGVGREASRFELRSSAVQMQKKEGLEGHKKEQRRVTMSKASLPGGNDGGQPVRKGEQTSCTRDATDAVERVFRGRVKLVWAKEDGWRKALEDRPCEKMSFPDQRGRRTCNQTELRRAKVHGATTSSEVEWGPSLDTFARFACFLI